MKYNTKLYNNIMNNISKQLKRTLNEDEDIDLDSIENLNLLDMDEESFLMDSDLAKNVIEKYGQHYINDYGFRRDNDIHTDAEETSTLDLINKTLPYTSKEVLAKALALVLDAEKYKTMSIMGLCRNIIGDDDIFEKIY